MQLLRRYKFFICCRTLETIIYPTIRVTKEKMVKYPLPNGEVPCTLNVPFPTSHVTKEKTVNYG